MFWDTQAQSDAATAAAATVGPQGRYTEGADSRFLSVRLYSKQAGPFWYGDLNWPTDRTKVHALAVTLKEDVFVLPDADATDPRSFTDQAIARVSP